ncbi:MAG: hypothetical protein Roseis2KO_49930 [Roseivirga sp.]
MGCQSTESSDVEQIQDAFSAWQKAQTASPDGEFVATENCNLEYVVNTEGSAMLGFPEDINFHYADVNGDDKSDALITFFPVQCDGGNAAMWMQYQLLVLSQKGSDYSIDEIPLHPNALSLLNGPYFLDSLSDQHAFGRYFEFVQGDARCCPSVNKTLTIDMSSFKVTLADLQEE